MRDLGADIGSTRAKVPTREEAVAPSNRYGNRDAFLALHSHRPGTTPETWGRYPAARRKGHAASLCA